MPVEVERVRVVVVVLELVEIVTEVLAVVEVVRGSSSNIGGNKSSSS